jgi:hypothetical protein
MILKKKINKIYKLLSTIISREIQNHKLDIQEDVF